MVLLGNINLRQAGSSAEAAEYSSGSLLCPAVASPARRLLDRRRFSNGFSLSFFLCGIFLLFILSLSLSRAGEFYLFCCCFCCPSISEFLYFLRCFYLCTFDQAAGSSAAITDTETKLTDQIRLCRFLWRFLFSFSQFFFLSSLLANNYPRAYFISENLSSSFSFALLFSIDHFFFFLLLLLALHFGSEHFMFCFFYMLLCVSFFYYYWEFECAGLSIAVSTSLRLCLYD